MTDVNGVFADQKVRLIHAVIRYFTGEERARLLRITTAPGCLSFLGPELLRTLFRFGERLEDKADGPARFLLDQLSRHSALAMIRHIHIFKGRSFHIPEPMRQAWFAET